MSGMREGVVIVVQRGEQFLVIQRAAHLLAGGAWCFVGGGIEPGETEADAVQREFHEEVGGEVQPVRRIWEFTHPSGRLRLYWWLAELRSEELSPNSAEVAELRWMTVAEILALPGLLEGNREFLLHHIQGLTRRAGD